MTFYSVKLMVDSVLYVNNPHSNCILNIIDPFSLLFMSNMHDVITEQFQYLYNYFHLFLECEKQLNGQSILTCH